MLDGEGLRTVVWTQGCLLRCPGCHNPGTHDLLGGFEESVEMLKFLFSHARAQQGVTFSGGEPFLQVDACAELARYARKHLHWNVWCYTGATFEELRASGKNLPLLREVDVLVDGPFILAQRKELRFRGSTNQRILRLRDAEIVGEMDAQGVFHAKDGKSMGRRAA
jgi:anaerobic ribonucleoside-triphosphate reductase activating protein